MRKLCEGYFTLQVARPSPGQRGEASRSTVSEVTGLGPLRTRLQRAVGRGLTKFVGRQAEIEALKQAAEQAKAGHGQLAAAVGEPGVGKSRLFYEFKAMAQSGCLVLETFSVSHGKASAYLPVIELLHAYFDIHAEDDARKRREKIIGKVLGLDRSLEDTLPYLFALLGLVEGEDPLAQLEAQLRRRRTLEAIKRLVLRESVNQPLLVLGRGSALDRHRDPGAAQPAGRRDRHGEGAAAGQLSPGIHPRLGQQDLLHAGAARSAGARERGGDAGGAARRLRQCGSSVEAFVSWGRPCGRRSSTLQQQRRSTPGPLFSVAPDDPTRRAVLARRSPSSAATQRWCESGRCPRAPGPSGSPTASSRPLAHSTP